MHPYDDAGAEMSMCAKLTRRPYVLQDDSSPLQPCPHSAFRRYGGYDVSVQGTDVRSEGQTRLEEIQTHSTLAYFWDTRMMPAARNNFGHDRVDAARMIGAVGSVLANAQAHTMQRAGTASGWHRWGVCDA